MRRYGRRVGLVTFSDQDTVTASAKAQNTLREKSVVKETFSLTTYGSDRIVAGVPDEGGPGGDPGGILGDCGDPRSGTAP